MWRSGLALLFVCATGCVDTGVPVEDAGTDSGACADPYDPVDGYRFDCPLVLDDVHTMGLDPAALPAGTAPCHAPQLAMVTRGVDGDTIHVAYVGGASDVDIRFIGVNAPEIMHPPDPTPAQCYGNEARDFTRMALEGHLVWLTYGESCTDMYGRTLAFVNLGPNRNDSFQRQLQRRGYSRIYTFSDNPDYASTYQADQDYAMSTAAGLWGACP